MHLGRKWIAFAPLMVLGVIGFITIGGGVVQALWNWLVPSIIGWREITFWQALGLLALCRILFGGRGHAHCRSRLRHRLAERWERMTPEERGRFTEGMRGHCGPESTPSEASEP
jgi:hypothetical protein